MNLVEFLQELSIKGWHLWSEGERLGYDAPQEESTAPVLAQLKQHKAEILQLLDHNPDVFNVYPLSYGQQSLWFLWQLVLNSYAYNVSFATRILSQTNVIVWRQAFETLKERHPILRSTFPKQGKKPIQQVHQNQELDFLQIDAATWGEDKLYKRVLEAHQQPFDLEQGPVIRVRWFTRSEQEHIMLLTAHHITCDGCSIEIIAGELLKIYQAQQSGVEISLPVLQHSYQDYVHWQTKMLASPQGERLWSYWQQQLKGLPVLNLPTDRPRPPIQTYNGASHRFSLSEKLSVQLSELAQQEGATLYMTFLATLQILLYRYTGQENILVGSPTLGRTRPEFSSIVGYFVNPVVLRANVSENPSFQDFLAQVRYTVLEALDHQDYPFALLVERLQPNRDFSRSPIFQVLFVPYRLQQHQEVQELFISETKTRLNWGGLELEPFAIPQFEGQFDLTLEMAESNSSLVGSFKYNTDLFNEQTIVRMAGHFQTLLEGIVANPEQKVAQLPLLTPDERQQLLIEWNNTARDYPDAKCIHQLFEEQVERTPEALALVYGEQQLTYSQLNEQANQLAHYLRSLGVQPETCVGLCIERSVELVVALLGILKAGGTYLPLATSYPQQRLAYMLSKSQATVLLTQSWLVDYLPPSAHVVCLDGEVFAQYSTENPISTVTPDNLAY